MRIISVILILFLISCKDNDEKITSISWGCPAPTVERNWLTFKYSEAILFVDSTGNILSALNDNSIDEFVKKNKGKQISEKNIKSINDALSCRLWICEQSERKDMKFFNPRHLIVFLNKEEITGYVTFCFESNIVKSFPDAAYKEIELMDGILRRLSHEEE